MIADEDAFEYFRLKESEVFSSREEFDGVRGILAYNRTDQEKGKATVFNPVNEWIVSVGKHPGIIPGKVWVAVQDNLERNKSKSYRRPRKNEALLTGLVFCACGNRMYPRLSKRTTADGEPIYTYVCKIKERSKKELCKRRNANGNTLDTAIIEQLKRLGDEKSDFVRQIEKGKMFYSGNREEYERRLATMRKEKADLEKKVNSLVDTLAETEDGAAKRTIINRMGEMNLEIDKLSMGIEELVSIASEHAFSDVEFDVLRQMLTMFKNGIDEMSYEQKRVAIRTVVRRIIWDGENAHIVLFGAEGEDIEYPDISHLMKDSIAETEDDEELVPFVGEDVDEDSLSDFGPEAKIHWGEDSKCNPFTNALMTGEGVLQSPIWRILDRLSGDLYLLVRTRGGQTMYAPLYVWQCALNLPRRFSEAQEFCRRYEREQNPTTADKLRWYRYQHGLMQSQVAQIMGISESTYKNLENGSSTTVAFERMDKLAKYYGIPVEELLDDYGRFLMNGQAAGIRAYRKDLNMGKKHFAEYMGIPIRNLRKWEEGKTTISRQSWERYFST